MRFLIRDDDTCAMTRPEELEACYRDVWASVPVGLSVTPFRVPGSGLGVPEHLLGSTTPLALSDNGDLVSFLRERIGGRQVHVALHGYHHTKPAGQPEYVAGDDLPRKTAHGKSYLEELLGCRLDTFVPPYNGLGARGYAAVAAARMNVVSNQAYPRGLGRSLSPGVAIDHLIAAQYAVRRRLGRPDGFAIRSFLRFKQAPYHALGPKSSLDELLARLRECRRCGGVFILATHYHAFGRRMESGGSVGDGLRWILDEVGRYEGTEFPTYAETW